MARDQQRFLWLGISILGVLALSSTGIGQGSPDSENVGPLPTDWSNQHLIFSNPATAEQATRLRQDPRYRQQLLRRAGKSGGADRGGAGGGAAPVPVDSR